MEEEKGKRTTKEGLRSPAVVNVQRDRRRGQWKRLYLEGGGKIPEKRRIQLKGRGEKSGGAYFSLGDS